MPAMPILLLETSNTYNFWTVGPKNTIFFSHEAYCEMHFYKKFKKSKNSVSSSDIDQNRFVHRTNIQSFRG
jgi:hypothetical protein